MSHYADSKGLIRVILMLHSTLLKKSDISVFSCLHQGLIFAAKDIIVTAFFCFIKKIIFLYLTITSLNN